MDLVRHSVSTWRQPLPPPASPARTALVRQVAARVTALGSGRLLVGIDGLTASGKTSFGHELAQEIATASRRPVLRAGLDDFKQPWKDRHRYDRESDIPGAWMSSRDVVGSVRPSGCLVVVGSGFEASVQDADEAVADLAEGGVVFDVAGA
ncbi:hypothetical protein [Nonomuraea jiangxiensis]|uniref:hypothetical protein n=1 Tax=Nonomuraea jiangxiensis TaxID=633440 RepID=UPI001C40AEA8|nr:hypothetical protein [Nonomuraea jiangxiensis]